MVEIEIGVMVSQCLDRRIPDKATTTSPGSRRVAATTKPRKGQINWLFTVGAPEKSLAAPSHPQAVSPARAAA